MVVERKRERERERLKTEVLKKLQKGRRKEIAR